MNKYLVVISETPKIASKWTVKKIINIYQTNGRRGIFRGLDPRIIKVAPACTIMVSTFEYGKTFFQNINMQAHN